MEKRTKYVINSVGRITRVRPSEVRQILKTNPEIRLCTQEEIDAFNAAKTANVTESAEDIKAQIAALNKKLALVESGKGKASEKSTKAADDEQPDPATVEEQIENLKKALTATQMREVIEAFDVPEPPANASKDGLAAIILDQEEGYETAMNYAKA